MFSLWCIHLNALYFKVFHYILIVQYTLKSTSTFYDISKRKRICLPFPLRAQQTASEYALRREKIETTRIKRSIGTELISEFKSNSTICHVLCCVRLTSFSRAPYLLQKSTRRFSCSWEHLFEGHLITHHFFLTL